MAILRVAAGFLILSACSSAPGTEESTSTSAALEASSTTTTEARSDALAPLEPGACADVIAVEVVDSGDGRYQVSATVSSADTGDEKYADEWRVVAPDGTVLGVRVLAHPHVNEQPFTRSLAGVEIGPDIGTVTVEARDSVEGYCGETLTVDVP